VRELVEKGNFTFTFFDSETTQIFFDGGKAFFVLDDSYGDWAEYYFDGDRYIYFCNTEQRYLGVLQPPSSEMRYNFFMMTILLYLGCNDADDYFGSAYGVEFVYDAKANTQTGTAKSDSLWAMVISYENGKIVASVAEGSSVSGGWVLENFGTTDVGRIPRFKDTVPTIDISNLENIQELINNGNFTVTMFMTDNVRNNEVVATLLFANGKGFFDFDENANAIGSVPKYYFDGTTHIYWCVTENEWLGVLDFDALFNESDYCHWFDFILWYLGAKDLDYIYDLITNTHTTTAEGMGMAITYENGKIIILTTDLTDPNWELRWEIGSFGTTEIDNIPSFRVV
jgi:hypothetical protein